MIKKIGDEYKLKLIDYGYIKDNNSPFKGGNQFF